MEEGWHRHATEAAAHVSEANSFRGDGGVLGHESGGGGGLCGREVCGEQLGPVHFARVAWAALNLPPTCASERLVTEAGRMDESAPIKRQALGNRGRRGVTQSSRRGWEGGSSVVRVNSVPATPSDAPSAASRTKVLNTNACISQFWVGRVEDGPAHMSN
jgi:hypothetical protein